MWKWLTLLVGFLALFMVACCSREPILNNPAGIPTGQRGHAIIVISDDFSPDDVEMIKAGVQMWVNAANGLYTVEYAAPEWRSIEDNVGDVLPSQRCVDVVVFELLTSFDAKVKRMDERPNSVGRTLGIGSHRDCGISRAGLVIDRIDDETIFRNVAAHEFGHAIGLDHVSGVGSIMYKNTNRHTSPCLTRDDLVEFCSEFYCNVEDTVYCHQQHPGCQ